MARPKDESGLPLPPAHQRLENAGAMLQAAVFALSADGRLCHLTMSRKLTIAQKAIDHVHDGAAEPKALFKKDPDHSDNAAMAEGWRACVMAVREVRP